MSDSSFDDWNIFFILLFHEINNFISDMMTLVILDPITIYIIYVKNKHLFVY